MPEYRSFWKSEFQNMLSSMVGTGNLCRWEEVSEELQNEESLIWEYVYRFSTKNSSVSILIYSSISKNNDKTRNVGSDAVRLVCEWQIKNGTVYKKFAKHNRVENMLNTVKKSITSQAKKCFQLNYGDFSEVNPCALESGR